MTTPDRRNILHLLLGLLVTASLAACSDGSDSPGPDNVLPIVFVHGQSGSAQQFESQAMRFTSNGYPAGQLFAFEYNTGNSQNPGTPCMTNADCIESAPDAGACEAQKEFLLFRSTDGGLSFDPMQMTGISPTSQNSAIEYASLFICATSC